jgi:hypothetical protein
MAISDPEIKYSGRVNNAAFTIPIDLTSGLGGGGGGCHAYNVIWITVVQDMANLRTLVRTYGNVMLGSARNRVFTISFVVLFK